MDYTFKSFMKLNPKDRTTLLSELLIQYDAQDTIELFCCVKCDNLGHGEPGENSEEFITCKDCECTFCKDCADEKIYRKVCESCTKSICKKCAKKNAKTCRKCKVFFCGECSVIPINGSANEQGRYICADCKE